VRLLAPVIAGLIVTTFAAPASAYGSGATGYTGKQEDRSCNSCHSGGTAPQVTINGPASIAAGATADFTLVVATKQTRAGAGIAATDGTTLGAGAGLQALDGELTHSAGLAVSGGKATFKFKVTAPASGTSLRLYAVGLAANGSGTGGDKATQITKDITVTGGSAATPTTPPASDGDDDEAADQATPSGTTTTTDGTVPEKKPAPADDDDDDDGNARNRRDAFTSDPSACSMHRGRTDGGAVLALLLGLAFATRRRR
jgi:hypothetical protein